MTLPPSQPTESSYSWHYHTSIAHSAASWPQPQPETQFWTTDPSQPVYHQQSTSHYAIPLPQGEYYQNGSYGSSGLVNPPTTHQHGYHHTNYRQHQQYAYDPYDDPARHAVAIPDCHPPQNPPYPHDLPPAPPHEVPSQSPIPHPGDSRGQLPIPFPRPPCDFPEALPFPLVTPSPSPPSRNNTLSQSPVIPPCIPPFMADHVRTPPKSHSGPSSPLGNSPPPKKRPRPNKGSKEPPKKPAMACLFCRHRKIACCAGTGTDRTCNQCTRRNLDCSYPAESRRGLRKGKASKEIASIPARPPPKPEPVQEPKRNCPPVRIPNHNTIPAPSTFSMPSSSIPNHHTIPASSTFPVPSSSSPQYHPPYSFPSSASGPVLVQSTPTSRMRGSNPTMPYIYAGNRQAYY